MGKGGEGRERGRREGKGKGKRGWEGGRERIFLCFILFKMDMDSNILIKNSLFGRAVPNIQYISIK